MDLYTLQWCCFFPIIVVALSLHHGEKPPSTRQIGQIFHDEAAKVKPVSKLQGCCR